MEWEDIHSDIVNRIPRRIDEVEFYFSPDRFEVQTCAVPHLFASDSHLMVRGSFDAGGEAFMVPRSARCSSEADGSETPASEQDRVTLIGDGRFGSAALKRRHHFRGEALDLF